MAKHNKGFGRGDFLTGRRKMKQAGRDLWNRLDLAPGSFMWSNERFCYSSLVVTFSRARENLASCKITT